MFLGELFIDLPYLPDNYVYIRHPQPNLGNIDYTAFMYYKVYAGVGYRNSGDNVFWRRFYINNIEYC